MRLALPGRIVPFLSWTSALRAVTPARLHPSAMQQIQTRFDTRPDLISSVLGPKAFDHFRIACSGDRRYPDSEGPRFWGCCASFVSVAAIGQYAFSSPIVAAELPEG